MKKPKIAIVLDWSEAKPNGFSAQRPFYALRENYSDAIAAAGAVPFLLPYRRECVAEYLAMSDGVMIPGGGCDVDPSFYGENEVHPSVKLRSNRTQFEIDLLRQLLAKNMPVLGICQGMQVLNVALGGKLIQHIPDSIPNALEHAQTPPFDVPCHDIAIVENSLLHKIAVGGKFAVNSSHHQAVKTTGSGVIISAKSPDGVIEAIESTAHRFCLGVQWHPEYDASPIDKKIFNEFVNICRA